METDYEYYHLKANSQKICSIVLTWNDVEFRDWGKKIALPTEILKDLIVDECVQNEYPEKVDLPPINGVIYSLEKYQPSSC
jgi:hypothetical protein